MKLSIAAILALVPAVFAAAWHTPVAPEGVVEFGGRSALLMDVGRFDPLVELEGRLEDTDHEFRYRALTAGSYYRLHKNLKAGAFYRLQWGARHDDDWIETGGTWEWEDSRDRAEQVLMLDLSPRFLFDFLPGENWVFGVKNRYMYNTFNNQHSLLVRPGLTYFLMRNREPLLTFSINYGFYIPLNFGEKFFYEHEPYLSVLYHLNRNVKLELTGAYRIVTWSSSEESLADDGFHYTETYKAFVLGFGVLFPVSF
jgi:hypothetical protein